MSPAPMYPIIAAIVFVHPVPIALMQGNAPADAPAANVYLTKLLIAICVDAQVSLYSVVYAPSYTYGFRAPRLASIDEVDVRWCQNLH
jgi:hypothetical protein